ncbi:MAG: hypothetical protein ACXAEL_02685 [Candidatus Hodarchaeales archaeon]|jgi:hypothetical protein
MWKKSNVRKEVWKDLLIPIPILIAIQGRLASICLDAKEKGLFLFALGLIFFSLFVLLSILVFYVAETILAESTFKLKKKGKKKLFSRIFEGYQLLTIAGVIILLLANLVLVFSMIDTLDGWHWIWEVPTP